MESKETIVLHPEDFEDFHKLAAKLFGRDPTQPGRPTKEEQEFRAFLTEFRQFKTLKETGVYDKFFDSLHKGTSNEHASQHSTRRDSRRRTREEPKVGIFRELLKGKFPLLELFTEETLQEAIKEGIVRYGPLIGLISLLYIAEETVEIPTNKIIKVEEEVPVFEQIPIFETNPQAGRPPLILRHEQGKQIGTKTVIVEKREKVPFPPIIHSSIGILMSSLRVLATLSKFMEEIGGFELFGNIGKDLTNEDGSVNIIKILDFLIFGPIGSQFTPF